MQGAKTVSSIEYIILSQERKRKIQDSIEWGRDIIKVTSCRFRVSSKENTGNKFKTN